MNEQSAKDVNPRFLVNIGDEPTNILQPIAGYENEPLLSLEDACEPLKIFIEDLPQYIWIAKQNSKQPNDGLSIDESAAIHIYTMEWTENKKSLYAQLNRTLRSVNRQALKPWFRYLKLFLTALFKLPTVEGVVWRGVQGDLSSQYVKSFEQAWWALSSCTLSLNILESSLYLGKTGTRTLFSIETYSGRRIRAHSYFKHEEEILLLPGTYFQVISSLSPAENLYLIHLKEKPASFSLLRPPFPGAQIRRKTHETLTIQQTRFRRFISFSDLNENSLTKHELGDISDGYANLRWHNVSYMHQSHALNHVKCQGTGYRIIFQNETRRQPSPYIALNSCGKSMIIRSLFDGRRTDKSMDHLTDDEQNHSNFTVHTIELQSASDDDLEIFIIAFKCNVKIFKKKVRLFIKKSSVIELEWFNIDSLVFESTKDMDDEDEDEKQIKERFHFILISIEVT